jgi:D-aminoacyl-tRNA deacylase
MRAVIQRVSSASVTVAGTLTGQVGEGFMILLGVGRGDNERDADYLAEKTANLRIFEDDEGKMNRSLLDTGGAALVISQFNLYRDARQGRRPGLFDAPPPQEANRLYLYFCGQLAKQGTRVQQGVFQAHMTVSLVNDGPVTLLLDSKKEF